MSATDSNDTWLIDYVFEVITRPSWEFQIGSFVDENCLIFDSEEENKLRYTELHNEFKELVERILNHHLAEVGVCEEDFFRACDSVYGTSGMEEAKEVIEQIIACDDFLTFKKLMFKRNKELELEAVSAFFNEEADQEDEVDAAEEKSQILDEDDEDMKLALRLSMMGTDDPDQHLRLAELEKEQADMETAIALSLAAEEEMVYRSSMAESKSNDDGGLSGKQTSSSKGASRGGMDKAESKTQDLAPISGSKSVAGGRLPSMSMRPAPMGSFSGVGQQRKAVEEFLSFDAAPKVSQADRAGIDQVELSRRAKHLKAQREKILQRKRNEREQKVKKYEQENKSKPSKEASIKQIPTTKINDGQYLTYALARKMKHDMAVEQSANGGAYEGTIGSSLDAKLRKVENIRREKASLLRA